MEENITLPPMEPDAPVEVVDIQFRPGQKVYFFDPDGTVFRPGDHVIIDTARGAEFGICAGGNHTIPFRDVVAPLRKVLRRTTPQDEKIEAMDKALAGNYDMVFIDTAGRLHNKSNLMDELQKIKNVLAKKHQGAPHRSILVIDATTGQNALQQTKVFKEIGGVSEIILTKLDGTAKGGVAMAVAHTFEVPITFVGLGEKMEDLRPFDADDYAKALLG